MVPETKERTGLSPEQRRRLGQAKALFRDGDVHAAVEALEALYRLAPGQPDVLHDYAAALIAVGRTDRAGSLLEEGIRERSEDVRLLFSSARCLHDRDPCVAEERYRRCLELRPGMAEAHLNLAQLLRSQGRAREARDLAVAGLGQRPDMAGLRMVLGMACQDLDDLPAAEEALREALRLQPGLVPAWNNLGNLLTGRGREREALEAFDEGLQRAPRHFELLVNRGVALHNLGYLDEAIASFERALGVRPEAAEALGAMGESLMGKLMPVEAEACFRRALASDPDSPAARRRYAQALLELERAEEAVTILAETVSAHPQEVEAAALLADTYERLNREEDAHRILEEGRDVPGFRDYPGTRLVSARLRRRAGELDHAVADLESVLAGELPTAWQRVIHHELGRLHEARKDADSAFRHFREGNKLSEAYWRAGQGDGPNPYLEERREDLAGLTQEAVAGWSYLGGSVRGPEPIFLVGFPRSGTTLLDQILDSHPDLWVMSERGSLRRVVDRLQALGDGDRIRGLGRLDDARREELRELYWHYSRAEGADPDSSRIVDKMPLSTTQAHVIRRVFPGAPVILAIRHPCDAVLSCFMQEFGFNAGMANFYRLEAAVDLYEVTMRLWWRSQELFGLDHHRIRYEDLVADPEAEGRRVVGYLGLDWDPALLAHADHARRRGRINTPSYHQVSQPIYRHAAYRWERYRTHLEPILDRLAPWAVAFGYPDPREGRGT